MTGYFARHWRGELSLPVSYWINGGLLSVPVGALVPWADRLAAGQSLRAVATTGLAALAFTLLFSLWSSVGIWRSAGRHASRGGARLWSVLARIMIAIGALALLYALVTSTGPLLKEYVLIALGQDPLGKVDVRASPDGRTVVLRGMLGEGATGRVKAVLDAAPEATTLVLDSPGGRLHEAEALARLVGARQMNTYVEAQCASACTYVFLAGKDRAATPNAKIGFHRPSLAGINPVAQGEATRRMLASYRAAGLPEAFLARIAETPSHSAWYPTRDELLAAHVLTRVSLGGETAAKTMTIASREDLQRMVAAQPLFQAYEARFPGSLALLVERGWQVREAGGSDGEVGAAMRGVISAAMPTLLSTASDELLDRFVDLYVTEMSSARAVSGEACQRLLDGTLDVAGTLPAYLVEQDQAMLMAMLTAKPRPPGRLNRNEAAAVIATTMRLLPIDHARVLHDVQAYAGQPEKVCDASIYFYRLVRSLPDNHRHLAERALFQRNG